MAAEDSKTADTSDDKRQSLGSSKARYADNILPMVKFIKFQAILFLSPNHTNFSGTNKEDHEDGSKHNG